ncbi:hypothetical protein [Flavobacterium caeni]|uniref:GLPGLI family protein n=1 Tax=Flavobacterium caeni TaxID=490189 RepID=A0A1G5KGY5_9FLAO|nr:hypothetical protein [Flavobacterium caeni]SCY99915.1 hypothetical protein SAMN02927903_03307 [Flavobacterium caeni]
MRKFVVTLKLLLFPLFAFSQINLSVRIENSQLEHSFGHYVDTLKIYKDGFPYKIIPYPDSFALFENVTSGHYKFLYRNIFDEQIEKNVALNEKDNLIGGQTVILFVDHLQNPKTDNLFFTKQKNGETIKIKMFYAGCFENGKDSIEITKAKNKLFLQYKDKKKKLNKKEIQSLVKFEIEMRHLPKRETFSTLRVINEIITENDKFSYNESGDWNGFNLLKKNLKL